MSESEHWQLVREVAALAGERDRLRALNADLLALLEEVVAATANCECGLGSCSICGADSLNGRIRAAIKKATQV